MTLEVVHFFDSPEINRTYFLLVLGLSLFDVFGLPDFLPLLVFGLIASSAPSAVYAKYTSDKSGSLNCNRRAYYYYTKCFALCLRVSNLKQDGDVKMFK